MPTNENKTVAAVTQLNLLKDSDVATNSAGEKSIHTYNKSSNLKLYLDIGPTLADNSTSSGTIDSLVYEGAQQNLFAEIGDYTYNTAKFDDSENRNAKVTYSSAPTPISPTDGSGNNQPFSVSVWFQRNSAHADSSFTVGHLFCLGDSSISEEIDIKVNENNGALTFSIRDTNTGNFYQATCTLATSEFHDKYAHLVCTYDGNTQTGMKVYLNGAIQSVTTGAAGAPVVRGVTKTLNIGAKFDGSNEWDGNIAEVAYFNTALSLSNINSIYLGTQFGAITTKASTFSGVASNPPRDVTRTLDKKIKMAHDGATKKANFNKIFDDENTVDFVERELIGSLGVEEGTTSTPLVISNALKDVGIKITHKFGSNFTTSQVRNTFEGDSDVTFNESEKIFTSKEFKNIKKVSIDEIDQAGIRRSADKKNIIEIDLNPSSDTTFGIESGVGSEAKNDLMVYWNNAYKRWEKIGGTFVKPNSAGNIASMLTDGIIGFAPTEGFVIPNSIGNFESSFSSIGSPVDNFGFPEHPKFHATSSQYIQMSDFISEPFIVEKMVYELDTTLYVDKKTAQGYIESDATTNYTGVGHLASCFTFFILNQNNSDELKKVNNSMVSNVDDTSISQVVMYSAQIDGSLSSIKSSRDLLGFMQILVYSDSGNEEDNSKYGKFQESVETTKLGLHNGFLTGGFSKNLNISGSDFGDSTGAFSSSKFSFDGKLILSGDVFEEKSHESYGLTFTAGGAKHAIVNLGNSRDNTDIIEKIKPRGFDNSLISSYKIEKNRFKHSHYIGSSKNLVDGVTFKNTFFSNFKKPNPYILFPNDNLIFGWQSPVTFNLSGLNDSNPSSQMKINAGTGKLKLYGSFIRNKKAYHQGGVFYSNKNVNKVIKTGDGDSFQIGTRNQNKGNNNTTYFDGFLPNRKGYSKSTSSEKYNSSTHFLTSFDNSETIYDTYIPSITSFLKRSGLGATIQGDNINSVSDLNVFKGQKTNEPIYIHGERREKESKKSFDGTTPGQTREIMFSKGFAGISGDNHGDSFEGAKSMKFGMYNYNITKNKAHFNTRRFGHFADFIDQRKIYAYEKEGKIIYPVVKEFVREGERINPIESSNQNISLYSTCSIPFIDNETPTYRTDDTREINIIKISADFESNIFKDKE